MLTREKNATSMDVMFLPRRKKAAIQDEVAPCSSRATRARRLKGK